MVALTTFKQFVQSAESCDCIGTIAVVLATNVDNILALAIPYSSWHTNCPILISVQEAMKDD